MAHRADGCAACGHRQHEKMHVNGAFAQAFPNFLGGKPAAGEIGERVATIGQALSAAPKSLQWKARAAVGRRVAWYELPEEIARG